ncbi:MAG: TRAP transporter small permease [Acetobacteraceae bacterium]|nr:TRAP transporter small permease [Acetobacteraceae bacterium]
MSIASALRAARALRRGVAGLAAGMAWAAGWNYVACALFITADVVGRNLLGVSSAATVEVTGYMLAVGIAWGLAHALARRAHIRVDVWVNRLPLRIRAPLHLFALLMLGGFGVFCAWAAWSLVDESLLFGATDNSALRVPLALPQGLWLAGIAAFCLMVAVLLLEGLLALLLGRAEELDRLLGARSLEDETAEALEAVAMARGPR